MKVDDQPEEAGTSIADKSEKMRHLPFFLTKVRNISEKFNNSKVAVGLRGDYRLTLIAGGCDGVTLVLLVLMIVEIVTVFVLMVGINVVCDGKGLLLITMIVV